MNNSLLENKLENFSKLPDQECASIIQNYLLEMFELEEYTYLEWEIITKFINIDYSLRDDLCQVFESALKRNEQQIAGIVVREWLEKYLEKTASVAPNTNNFYTYILNNPEIKKLDKRDQVRLMRIFRMHDYLFIIPILNLEGPAAKIMRFPMRLNSSTAEISAQFSQTSPIYKESAGNIIQTGTQEETRAPERLSLSDALKKFPELGEQLITSNRIKLKSFPEPVRPSINNWLSDYTFNLGFESHSAMDRGTYLFRNENAKVLNSTDREKISYILKAYDENSLVDVNVNTKQIVFPKYETRINEQRTMNNDQKAMINKQRTIDNNQQARINTSQFQAPQRNIQEIYNSQKQEVKPKDIFKEERIATENRNAGNINFSSPQRMPYEKQTIQPIQPQKPTPSPQPMRISSQNLRKTDIPPGNIVNLKDQ